MPFILPALPAIIGAGASIGGALLNRHSPSDAYTGDQREQQALESALMGESLQDAQMRRNLYNHLYPRWMSEMNQVPRDLLASRGYVSAASPYIEAASPLINRGREMVELSVPLIKEGTQDVRNATPTINHLESFLTDRMNLGSPYYTQRLRQAIEEIGKMYASEGGNMRSQMAQAFAGAPASGAPMAAMGELTNNRASTMAEAYLQNLFQNEQSQMDAASQLPQVATLKMNQGNLMNEFAQSRLAGAGALSSLAGARIGQANAKLGQAGAMTNLTNARMNYASAFDPRNLIGGTSYRPSFTSPVNPGESPWPTVLRSGADIVGSIMNSRNHDNGGFI